ncbi:uncharacterized protein A4U43_C10F2820 [Asparagus officinalis]|uniref:Late embryogenesis abundant protein LEA-2 subgroup domain-containing protein n=1 Tax=Asparagus officinalis TaxID=4686 RepID=A0A5P1E056_ASPOF|nr:NDR1/HIN1-like protein 1 [Asparagus officinalis]ONK55971.1 uncharacterized protein A4U43_C10F2820 [Asparagus officinalis]
MSLLTQSSPKHCANKGFHLKTLLNRKLLYTLSTLISSLLFVILLIYLILHPSKPQFYLQNTTVSNLALSSVQATILSKNPNTKVGVYYDDLRAYAVYKGQQITAGSALPPFFQEHEDSNVLSASMYGAGMPVTASAGYEVGRDQEAGRAMALTVRIDGKLRWKVGSWVSGKYRFNVDCVAIIGIGSSVGGGGWSSVQGTECSTSV